MPSQRGKAPAAAVSRSGRSIVGRNTLCEDGDDGDNEVLHRDTFCGLLYSKEALKEGMKGELRAVHVHRDFRLPAQDPTKVQFFDPDRGRKSLGMTKAGGARPPARLNLSVPTPLGKEEEPDDFHYEPLVLWEPPPEVAEDGEGDAAMPDADEGAGAVAGEDAAAAATDGAEGAGDEGAAAAPPPPKPPKAPPPKPIEVDPKLCRFLRSHQREGTQFLFNCLMGLRDFDGCGWCVLSAPRRCRRCSNTPPRPAALAHAASARRMAMQANCTATRARALTFLFALDSGAASWPTTWASARRCSRLRSCGR